MLFFEPKMSLISLFKNCKATIPSQDVEFLDVLEKIKSGYWEDEFLAYKRGKIKKEDLPCFTASAAFSGGRKKGNVVSQSGVINIDIDAKHNPEINLVEFRDTLYGDKYVYAGHLSAGGAGLSLYININPDKHFETFLSLEKYFANNYKIVIDPATKDITRLRFVVYDPELVINHRAAKYLKYEKKANAEYQKKDIVCVDDDIEFVVAQIERDRYDLTAIYADWIKIAFALNNEFGEKGEDFFHRLSQHNPGYNPTVCSRKYKQCRGGGVKIASFFFLAKEAGYEIVSPKTKSIIKTARYAKKALDAGIQTADSAKSGAIEQAIEMQGADKAKAEKIIEQVFNGASDEKDSADDIYDFITKDIEAKKLRRNLVDDIIEFEGKMLTELGVNLMMVEMRTKYGSNKIKKDHILELIDAKAKDYHPIFEFIERNRHRKPKGCIDAVIDSINGDIEHKEVKEARAFRRYYIRKWLIGMMSCWHGTYSLLTLCLVGGQGTGKSKWIRGLLPEDLQPYYAEAKMDGDKDHLTLMTTKALIMDDEFSGKSRREEALFKELSSKQEITIRKPYARKAETHTRIAALAGTTNDENIKNDQTGNRRIIPIHVSSIDWDAFYAVDKVDLIIEIYHEWKKIGDGWMMTSDDILKLNFSTDRYKDICPEEELLIKYFDQPKKTTTDQYMTNTEILNELSGKLTGSSIRLSGRKLGQVLKAHGYSFKQVKIKGTPTWVYEIQRTIAQDDQIQVDKNDRTDGRTFPF
jgi:predicted P-loop ATPase